jgi:hypothetical protein
LALTYFTPVMAGHSASEGVLERACVPAIRVFAAVSQLQIDWLRFRLRA